MMTKAIIFDCFGVLSVSTYDLFYKEYFNNDPKKVEQARLLDRASNQGEITLHDFYAGVAEIANISIEEAREFISNYQANEPLLEYIESSLKPHYKIGFLSNVADNLLDKLFTPKQLELFDDFVLSYEVGISKPDARVFHLSAERLGVTPKECLFVDDVQRYCDAAALTGMKTILHRHMSVEQFGKEFQELLHD